MNGEEGPIVHEITEQPVAEQKPPEAAPPRMAQAPEGGGVAEAKCAKCQAVIYLRMPPARVMNTPEFSQIVFCHEVAQVCQNCGQGYVPVIRGIVNGHLDIQFAPIQAQREPLIVPASPQQRLAVDKTKARGLVMP